MSKLGITKFDELMDSVSKYIKDKNELNLIEKAYNVASSYHLGALRKSGEPYIQHPLNVAMILTEIYADYETICAALLHDTVEDTSLTLEEVEKEFSHTIAVLVDGVTKINKINFLF